MQTSREVIGAMFRGETPERVGLAENIWGDTLRAWTNQGYPVNAKGDPLPPHEHFDFDIASAGGWFDPLPIRGHKELLEETPEWTIKRNGAGAAFKYWKNKSGTPEHVDFLMTSREVWQRDYRHHVLDLDRQRLNVQGSADALKRLREQGKFAVYGHLFIWENMRQSMGDVCLYESMLLDPEWIADYAEVYTDFFIKHFGVLYAEAGLPDGLHIHEDMGYSRGLFCSPATFGKLIFPYFRRLVEWSHSFGVPVLLHTCGRITDALDMIVDAGFDYLDPMERKAGCDPLAYAERYRDRLVFRGGLDARVLETHDRDTIRREVSALIDGMKSRGARYIFASDHSISTNVRYDDYRYALDVYREHMWY